MRMPETIPKLARDGTRRGGARPGSGKHQSGSRSFGYRFGRVKGSGKARELIPDPGEQQAIADVVAMRQDGCSLMHIRDTPRARGFQISHQSVANILARLGGAA